MAATRVIVTSLEEANRLWKAGLLWYDHPNDQDPELYLPPFECPSPSASEVAAGALFYWADGEDDNGS